MRAFGRARQVLEVESDLTCLELVRDPARAEVLAEENIKQSRVANDGGIVYRYGELAEAD
jgi:hypothetical protein